MFSLNEIGFFNKDFWIGFLATSFPNCLYGKSLSDTNFSIQRFVEFHR